MVLNMNALNSRNFLNAFTMLQTCYTSSIQQMSSIVGLLGTPVYLAYLAVESAVREYAAHGLHTPELHFLQLFAKENVPPFLPVAL